MHSAILLRRLVSAAWNRRCSVTLHSYRRPHHRPTLFSAFFRCYHQQHLSGVRARDTAPFDFTPFDQAISTMQQQQQQRHFQDAVHESSIQDPERFWMHHAGQLSWHKKPSHALDVSPKTLPSGTTHQHWSWFPDGEISTAYNCVDRHVERGYGDTLAIVWESPVTGLQQKLTYRQLLDEVETLAGVLQEEGVKKGDVVLIYSMLSPFHLCLLPLLPACALHFLL